MTFLIISHFFAPYSHVGAKRMTALAAFLAEKGDTVWVLKANDSEYGVNINTKQLKFENIKIVSLPSFFRSSLLRKILRNEQYWRIIKKLVKQISFDVVIISGGPFNYFNVIPKIKNHNPKIKCILDFRDILDGSQCQQGHVNILQKLGFNWDIKIEKRAVEKADLCLTVSDSMNKYYQSRYLAMRYKFISIQNGYDDILVDRATKNAILNYNKFTHNSDAPYIFGIFGKFGFYNTNYYSILVKAVTELKKHGMQIIIKQFGVYEKELEKEFFKAQMSKHYIFCCSKGYSFDVKELQKCDAVIASSYIKEALGTKVFDYIWINRPIITFNPHPESEQIKLTRLFEHGFTCQNEKDFILSFNLISQLNLCILDKDDKKRLKYGRRYQYEKFYKLLKEYIQI